MFSLMSVKFYKACYHFSPFTEIKYRYVTEITDVPQLKIKVK